MAVHATRYDPSDLAARFDEELRPAVLKAFQTRRAFENMRLTDPVERESSRLDEVTRQLAELADEIEARAADQVDPVGRYFVEVELAYCRLLRARSLQTDERREAFEDLSAVYGRLANEHPDAVVPAYRLATVCFELGRIDDAIRWSREALSRFERDPFGVDRSHPVRQTIARRLGVFLFRQATGSHRDIDSAKEAAEGRHASMLEALEIDLEALAACEEEADSEWRRLERRRLANNALFYAISFLKSGGQPDVLRRHGYTETREGQLLDLAGAGDVDGVDDHVVVDTIREVQQFRGRLHDAERSATRVLEILKVKAQRAPLDDRDSKIFEESLALLRTAS